MENKKPIAIVLVIILVGVLIVAINFMVKKYESESMPIAVTPAVVLQPAPVSIKAQEPNLEEGQVSPQGGDSQFSTENGKLLR